MCVCVCVCVCDGRNKSSHIAAIHTQKINGRERHFRARTRAFLGSWNTLDGFVGKGDLPVDGIFACTQIGFQARDVLGWHSEPSETVDPKKRGGDTVSEVNIRMDSLKSPLATLTIDITEG